MTVGGMGFIPERLLMMMMMMIDIKKGSCVKWQDTTNSSIYLFIT